MTLRARMRRILLLIACAVLAQVVLAQNNTPGVERRNALPGKIIAVDAARQQIRVSLYQRIDADNAPGKVPDEMVRKASELETQANNLELYGNARLEEVKRMRLMQQTDKMLARINATEEQANKMLENVQRMRDLIQELMHWRESDRVISAADAVSMTTKRRVTLDKISKGDRVSVVSRMEGIAAENAIPTRVTLMADMIQLDPMEDKTNITIKRTPSGMPSTPPGNPAGAPYAAPPNFTIFDIVGFVTAVNPLTLSARGSTIQVETPQQFGYVMFVTLSIQDLQPGMPIMARLRPREDKIVSLFILPPGSNNPFIPFENPTNGAWWKGK